MPDGFFSNFRRQKDPPPLTFDDVLAMKPKPVAEAPKVPNRTANVVDAFDAMALHDGPTRPARDFVGGFHIPTSQSAPNNRQPNFYHTSSAPPPPVPGPLPRPPTMPTPHSQPNLAPPAMSLTMQHALRQQPDNPKRTLKPTPSITPWRPPQHKHTTSESSTLQVPVRNDPRRRSDVILTVSPPEHSSPTTPKRPSRPRAASTPPRTPPRTPSATSNSAVVQCSGVTKAGNRCKKQVKVGETSMDDDQKHFCHQHAKEVLSPTGTYARKTGEWIEFSVWIPRYLHEDTQIALREEMDKARSSSDRPGYIYTFEIRDPDSPNTAKLKVGRAVNLVKRIDEWTKQCGSKEQVLKGFYPGVQEDEDDDDAGSYSLMKGRVRPGEPTACCHRLERLVHLELNDLATRGIHLQSGWPTKVSAPASDGVKSPKKTAKKDKCADCGQVHKEIFEFARFPSGKYKNKEFESIVQPVIEKWAGFVEAYI